MEVTSKRYNHDHFSSYKNRGDKLGPTNRFVRAQKATNDRKNCRQDKLTKRRGLGLLNEQNISLEKVQDAKTQKSTVKSKAAEKAKTTQKENVVDQATDQRKAMLMKWRENRELKKKEELAKKNQKTTFAVRHIQYETNSFFAPTLTKQTTKKGAPKTKENVDEKRVTRSSARLANKQPVKPVTRGKIPSNSKETKATRKPVAPKKNEMEQPKRVTRQSVRVVSTFSAKPSRPSKKKEENKLEERNSEEQSCTESKEVTPANLKKQQRKSFAPANFQFTAPSGLFTFENYGKEFKFQPLSPTSTEEFFQGISIPSSKENFIDPLKTKHDKSEVSTSVEKDNAKEKSLGMSPECVTNSKDSMVDNVDVPATKLDVIDSSYFRNLMSSETTRLNGLCDQWEKVLEIDEELSEEVKGNIRTAVGQAQLLISQRFKQFSGLIDLSEDETAEKKATMSDLQGFWDMIYFQVEDVNKKMDELEKQKQNGWVVETQSVKKASKKMKKIAPKKSEGGKAKKSGAKSKLQEMRAAMKAKMAEKKRQLQSQDIECSFITVLTPVKRGKKSGLNDDIILTPVRRSLRNTPISQSASRVTTKIISTPKVLSADSPGLRLTPEVMPPIICATGSQVNDDNSEPKEEEVKCQHNEGVTEMTEKIMDNPEPKQKDQQKDGLHQNECVVEKDEQMENPAAAEKQSKNDGNGIHLEVQSSEHETESTDKEMEVVTEDVATQSSKRRSCLRSSTRRTRKSSHVFFQSPEPSVQSTAGDTPGPLAFTPAAQTSKSSRAVVFTPVAVSFDSPGDEGNTCSADAGHTPAMVLSGRRSARRTSKGNPISGHKRHLATPDSTSMGTPISRNEGSATKRRSLRHSGKKTTPLNEKECSFLPTEYILPSVSSESEDELPPQTLTPIFSQESPTDTHQLLAITPLKDTETGRKNLNLTPASMFQTLSLDDSLETRRDSVFFAPSGGLIEKQEKGKDNLICFSPFAE